MKRAFTRPSLPSVACFRLLAFWLFAAAWPAFSTAQNLQVSLPDYAICLGSSDTLMPQVSGGTPPYNYAWSPAAGLSCADCENPLASPPITTMYSLTVTDQAGGEATAATQVTVLPNPATNLFATICEGETYFIGTQGYTQSGIHTQVFQSYQGCDSTVTVNLTVLPYPAVSVSPSSTSVCAGAFFPITATASGGTGSCNYQWQISTTPAGPWSNVAGNWNTPEYFPPTQGWAVGSTHYYRVIYTCPAGGLCNSNTSNVVAVTVTPQPELQVSPAVAIACIDEPVLLTAHAGGGTGACSIQWYSGPGYDGPWTPIPGATDSTYLAPTNALGAVYYIAQFSCDGLACAASFSANAAKVVTALQPGIVVNPADSIVDPGDPVTFTASTTSGSDTCAIQWQSAPLPQGPWMNIAGATDTLYTPPTDSAGTRYYRAIYNCADATEDFDFDIGVQLRIGDAHNVVQGEQFCVDVTTKSFTGVTGMRFAIEYDYTALRLLSLENIGLSGYTSHAFSSSIPGSTVGGPPGYVGVWWPNPSGPVSDTLPDGAVLFTLCFEAIADSGPIPIRFAGPPFPTWIKQSLTPQPFYRIPGTVYFGGNCYSANSNVAPLTVETPATIVIDTADFAVCIGAPVTLRADTTGSTEFCAVQWQSAPAPDGPWTDIPGADSLSYPALTDQADTSHYRAVFFCTDTGGADTSNVATVIVLEEMTLELTVVSPLCPGDLGSIQVQGDPAFGDFTFTWNTGLIIGGGSSQMGLGDLSPGLYCVTMTATNGCAEVTDCAEVIQPPPGIIVIPDIIPPSCGSSADGAITPAVTGGTPPYNYSWSTGSTILSIFNLPPGTYSLTVADADGCEQVQLFQLDPALTADAGSANAIICNDPDVELQGSASLSGPNIGYAWYAPDGTIISDQTTVVVSEAGLYRFRAANTDVAGCFSEDEVLVEDFTNVIVQDMAMTLIACNTWRLEGIVPPDYFGQIDFEWTLPGGSVTTGPAIIATESGVYQLRISIPGSGCESVVARFIDVGNDECAVISGRVVFDTNENCIAETGEDGLAGWIVRAAGIAGVFHAITGAGGDWQLSLPLGNYVLGAIPPTTSWTLCAASYPVALNTAGQAQTLDIPVRSEVICPELDVQLSTSFLRRCFANNLNVRVCNTGTEAVQAPRVTLVLDDFLEYEASQYAPESVNGQTITWVIPPLGPSGCRQFWVRVRVSCDAVLGQSHCSTITATPDSLCTPAGPAWSGASLEVLGECTGEEAVFRVRNTGTGDLTDPVQYIVIEDVVMLMQMPNTIDDLPSGSEQVFEFPANGSTWFLSVEQAPNHPFSAVVTAALEGCGTDETGAFSTGFVHQLPLQTATPASFTLCLSNIGAYDPNDKQAIPEGYGEKHFVHAGDPLHYKIRFQNTGTDTAFTVVIRDTLSPWLDITTLRAGPSSHDYRLDIAGERTLTFTFDNILLPDSTANLEASQGYVDFFIRIAEDAPIDTRIENSAGIYFDFNEPVITNTVFHTVGTDFIRGATAVFLPAAPAAEWLLMPNPAREEAWLVLKKGAPGLKTAWLYDTFGRQVLRLPFEGERCRLPLTYLTPGWYVLRLTDAGGRSLGAGRLVVK